MKLTFAALVIGVCTLAQTGAADVIVRFDEGAPKDRFTLQNAGACPLIGATVTLDLTGSAGGLIFDVTGGGAGVSVFQPFEVTLGDDALAKLPRVLDGDRAISMNILTLPVGGQIAFTIDVDDTLGQRATVVSDAEIRGAELRVMANGEERGGTFNNASVARVTMPPCAAM